MNGNYGDYIVCDKNGSMGISLITNHMNLNRHTHLSDEDIIFIDNNSYELAEIEELIDEGSAIIFYKSDVDDNTNIIHYVNELLKEDWNDYEIYGLWIEILATDIKNVVEKLHDSIEVCEGLDTMASDLVGIDRGYYKEKETLPNGALYAKILMMQWKKHLKI